MKISACWIVKNEGTALAASIMSVKDCAGELIVTDTGSTDDTVRIAREHGARVEHFKWTDDFAAARNFCLSFAAGEYVIFLDADEYFEPALHKADRYIIADIFSKTGVDTLQVNRIELDINAGKVIGSEPHARLLRRAAIHYEQRIHELMTVKDGKAPATLLLENYRLMHTGYSADRVMEKYRRNIRYLEAQQAELHSVFDRFHNHAYLMREYAAVKDYEKAVAHCRYLLDHDEQWEAVCKTFSYHYIQRFYNAISIAAVKRFSFSRKEVYRKLIQVMQRIYAGSRETSVVGLYYQMIFDYRGDRFLRELAAVELLTAKAPALDAAESRSAEASVYGRGALEAYYRGDRDRASRWAETALKIMPDSNAGALRALMAGRFTGTDSPVGQNIIKGDYKTAYEQITQGFDTSPLDHRLLEFLHIIADKEGGDLALEARRLYDLKRELLDEAIDLSDVVNTGYVEADEVKSLTLAAYKARPVTEDILALHALAAPVYEKKNRPMRAMYSHLLLYAKSRDPETHRQEFMRLFRENGGGPLSEAILSGEEVL